MRFCQSTQHLKQPCLKCTVRRRHRMGSASGKSKAACLILHLWRSVVAALCVQQHYIILYHVMGHTGTRTTSGNPKRKARPGTSQSAGYPTHGLIFLSQVWLVARFVRVIPCAGATSFWKVLRFEMCWLHIRTPPWTVRPIQVGC